MKKLMTLLFFAGFLTTAFAQSGHKRGNSDQTNGNGYQQGQNSVNSHNQFSQNGRKNRSNKNGYGKSDSRANTHGYRGDHEGYSRHNRNRFGNDHYRKNSHRGWFHKRNRYDRY